VNRAGAGGNRPGVFGIRPNGQKFYDEAHEMFTPKGLFHKGPKKNPPIKDDGKKRDGPPLEILLPLNYCPYCKKEDKLKEDMAYGDIRVVGMSAGLEHIRIYPGHLIQYYMCKMCDLERKAELDAAGILHDATGHGPKESVMFKWAEKAWEHAKFFISRAYVNSNKDIFVGRKLRGEVI